MNINRMRLNINNRVNINEIETEYKYDKTEYKSDKTKYI